MISKYEHAFNGASIQNTSYNNKHMYRSNGKWNSWYVVYSYPMIWTISSEKHWKSVKSNQWSFRFSFSLWLVCFVHLIFEWKSISKSNANYRNEQNMNNKFSLFNLFVSLLSFLSMDRCYINTTFNIKQKWSLHLLAGLLLTYWIPK